MTRHIQFSPEEEAELVRRSQRVGLPVTHYIREMALNGSVRGYNVSPILQHTLAIGDAVAAIRAALAAPHDDRWQYEADLDLIEAQLDELLDTEAKLLDLMRRKMRR